MVPCQPVDGQGVGRREQARREIPDRVVPFDVDRRRVLVARRLVAAVAVVPERVAATRRRSRAAVVDVPADGGQVERPVEVRRGCDLHERRRAGRHAEVDLLHARQLIGRDVEDVDAAGPVEAERREARVELGDRPEGGRGVGAVVVGAGRERRTDRREAERDGARAAADRPARPVASVQIDRTAGRPGDDCAALLQVELPRLVAARRAPPASRPMGLMFCATVKFEAVRSAPVRDRASGVDIGSAAGVVRGELGELIAVAVGATDHERPAVERRRVRCPRHLRRQDRPAETPGRQAEGSRETRSDEPEPTPPPARRVTRLAQLHRCIQQGRCAHGVTGP